MSPHLPQSRILHLLFLSGLLISGCASPVYYLSISTYPEGAKLSYQGSNQAIGTAPTVLTYPVDARYMSNGCYKAAGFAATWMSGAKAASEPVVLLCHGVGTQHSLILQRPASIPGLDGDMRIAELHLKHRLEQERRQQEQMLKSFEVLGKGLEEWAKYEAIRD